VGDLDSIERRLQIADEFCVGSRKGRRRCARQAAVAEQQSQRIRIERQFARREENRCAQHRKLEAVLMRASKLPDHLA
jgi:hypothetical protein